MKYASLEISFQRLCWVSPTIFTRQFARWITFTLQRTPPRPSFFESPPWRNGKVRSLIFDISFQSVLTFNPNHFYSSFFLNRKHQDFRLKPSIIQSMIQPCTAPSPHDVSNQRPFELCAIFSTNRTRCNQWRWAYGGIRCVFPPWVLWLHVWRWVHMVYWGLKTINIFAIHPPLRSRLVVDKNWANCRRIPKSWIEVIFQGIPLLNPPFKVASAGWSL